MCPSGFGGPPISDARPNPSPTPLAALGTASYALSYYLPFVLDDNISDESKQVLLDLPAALAASLTPTACAPSSPVLASPCST
jgi:hypothetical protein